MWGKSCSPLVSADKVVVTGFVGTVWWLGDIAVVTRCPKKPHVVYYEGDDTKVPVLLNDKNYGPATVTPARRCGKGTVKLGWMHALPTEVAGAAAQNAHD